MNLFRRLEILATIRLVTVFIPIFFFFLYLHNIYGVFSLLFLTMILTGAINPKFNALIMNNLPEEKLAMIAGGIGTYFQLGGVLLRLLVSGLILPLPVDGISLAFLALGLYVVFYTFGAKKEAYELTA